MAKKASGPEQDVAGEMKGVIATLRRRRLFFAIAMDGKTPVLKTHLKKKPKTLRKEAKSAGGGPKGCSGEIGLNGKILELHCVEEDVPDIIAKLTTKYLRENGLNFRVAIAPGAMEEPEDEESEEEVQASEAPQRVAAETTEEEAPARAEAAEAAEEAAADELEDAGIETAASAAGAAAEETSAAAAAEEAAPAGRTRDQERLLGGLRDIKTLLKQVTDTGQSEDVARMRKFGDLFKKAVKQNDAQVGQKVLDGMRKLAKQVEATAQRAQKVRQERRGRLDALRNRVSEMMSAIG